MPVHTATRTAGLTVVFGQALSSDFRRGVFNRHPLVRGRAIPQYESNQKHGAYCRDQRLIIESRPRTTSHYRDTCGRLGSSPPGDRNNDAPPRDCRAGVGQLLQHAASGEDTASPCGFLGSALLGLGERRISFGRPQCGLHPFKRRPKRRQPWRRVRRAVSRRTPAAC